MRFDFGLFFVRIRFKERSPFIVAFGGSDVGEGDRRLSEIEGEFDERFDFRLIFFSGEEFVESLGSFISGRFRLIGELSKEFNLLLSGLLW